jgi:hypothetical protein
MIKNNELLIRPGLETDEAIAARRAIDCQLGNPELPIADYRGEIVAAVDSSQAVVLTAETGAGKSTQVPQFLAEAGYEVIVTQPRIVAARSVSERVRDEIVAVKGPEFAEFVGYRTAKERNDSPNNQILYATDGLQLVRELSGNGVGKKQVLVLDEVHEWNENMEVLVAWAKRRMREDPSFKVVVMSATMESGPLARYLAGEGEYEVPIIEVPGRTYEVEMSEGGDVVDEAAKFAKNGKNVLVFVPGKQEINEVIGGLRRYKLEGVTILPLHGQLESAEQRKVFQHYGGSKIVVATNVAETSITIDDIDAVVDSGLARQNEVRNGIEGLYVGAISQDRCMQRAGRAGRTKEGEYVLAQVSNHGFVALADRPKYGMPEILRTRLDRTALRLAKNGFDVEALEFYHQPEIKEIVAAKARLKKLGAMNEDGSITGIGRDMERLPIESHCARMMVEARRYGPEVRAQLAVLLAVQEVEGITFRGRDSENRWRGFTTGDGRSDPITELEVFIQAQELSTREQCEADIIVKNLSRAREISRQLYKIEHLESSKLTMPDKKQREQLIKCIISGMVDNLYTYQYRGEYINSRGDARDPSNRSSVRPQGRSGEMIVGDPFDLQIQTRRGSMILHLLQNITQVQSAETLREVAPQLFSEKRSERFDFDGNGIIVEAWSTYFDGLEVSETIWRETEPSPERLKWLADNSYFSSHRPRIEGLRQTLNTIGWLQLRTTERLPLLDIKSLLYNIPESVASLDAMDAMLPDIAITDLVSQEKIDEINAQSPDVYNGMVLTYCDGQPVANIERSDEVWVAIPDEGLRLPDGRDVMAVGDYGSLFTLSQLRESARKRAQDEKDCEEAQRTVELAAEAVRVEAERVRKEEQAAAEERYRQEREETARELAAARMSAKETASQISTLMEGEDIEYISDDLYNQLEDLVKEYNIEYYRYAGDSDAVTRILRWVERCESAIETVNDAIAKHKARETVTFDDLARLAAHFNS